MGVSAAWDLTPPGLGNPVVTLGRTPRRSPLADVYPGPVSATGRDGVEREDGKDDQRIQGSTRAAADGDPAPPGGGSGRHQGGSQARASKHPQSGGSELPARSPRPGDNRGTAQRLAGPAGGPRADRGGPETLAWPQRSLPAPNSAT